jgi:hypothetical protein
MLRVSGYGFRTAFASLGFRKCQMPDLIRTFSERGDLAHLALLLWAGSATALLYLTLRALIAATRRFDDFVRELSRFNERHITARSRR